MSAPSATDRRPWVARAGSSPSWPQPDFLDRGTRRPLLAWIWAATGAMVLALTVADTLDARAATEAARARLERADQRVARLRKSSDLAPALPDKSPGRSDADALRAARATADRLSHPWGRLLVDLEAESTPGVQWLLFDHDADSREVRMEGVSIDANTALKLVDALGARRGWSDVVMSRLDAPDARTAAGADPTWHFELRASIDPRALAARAED